MQRLFPGPVTDLDDEGLRALYAHPRCADGSSWVRANVVSTLDGATSGVDGSSVSISSPTDRDLLVTMRRAADVVLVGASTAARESYRVVRTPIAVASSALDIDPDDPLYRAVSTVVLTSTAAPRERRDRLRCRVVALPGDRVEPRAAVAALVGLGLTRVLCEGGPRLLGSFVAADAVDELCLTISPLLAGGPAARVALGTAAVSSRMRPVSLCTDGSAFFSRHLRDRSPGSGED